MVPIIDHALFVTALAGQTLIASNIDRGIWFSGFVQEPVEIRIFDQACIINLAMFDDEDVRDPEKREELLSLMDMKNCVANSKDVPLFIAWGTKDSMVGSTETPAYIEAARKIGINITEIVAGGQDHGFGQNYYMADYLEWLKKQ